MNYVKADTMSVITKGETSVAICITLGPEVDDDMSNYCNATLRLDRGHRAVVCGYPQNWAVWSEPIYTHDHDSPTGEEVFDDGNECFEDYPELGYTHHVSRVDEYNILADLKRAIVKQFRDPMWRDHGVSIQDKLAVIQKLDEALRHPDFAHIHRIKAA